MICPETSTVFEYPSSEFFPPSVENTLRHHHLKSSVFQTPDLPIDLDET